MPVQVELNYTDRKPYELMPKRCHVWVSSRELPRDVPSEADVRRGDYKKTVAIRFELFGDIFFAHGCWASEPGVLQADIVNRKASA